MDKLLLIHGDVGFYQADAIPQRAKKINVSKNFVIQHGESGHTHTLENECEVYIDEEISRMYFKETTEPVKVNHEEHGLQEVISPTKISYVDIEQEYDHETEEARMSRD